MPEFSSETWTYIIVGLVVLFSVGVVARVRNLMRISKDIESKLDYSKMKEWEDDDDWGEPPKPSPDNGTLTDHEGGPVDRRDPRK